MYQISIQSGNSIESYRVHRRRTDRQFRKNRFPRISKRKDLVKIPKMIFHIKLIPSHMMRMYNKPDRILPALTSNATDHGPMDDGIRGKDV